MRGVARRVCTSTWPGPKAYVAVPPVYDPGGPVLVVPSVNDAGTTLAAAADAAPELGCPAIVVVHVAGDDDLARALSGAGFRRHCDYFTGAVRPI